MAARKRVQRIELRVRVRERRRRGAGRVVAASVVAAAAVWGLGRFQLPGRVRRSVEPWLVVASVDASGVPETVRAAVAGEIRPWVGRPLGPREALRRERFLGERFPYLSGLRVSRSWWRRAVSVSAALRRPVARLEGGVWLDPDGTVFEAPGRVLGDLQDLPRVEGPCAPERLRALGPFLADVRGRLALARIAAGPDEGWTFEAPGGPRVVWGGLDGTSGKLDRLDQVLEDARRRFAGVESVDLRFYEDGRVLVRPARL